MAELNEAAIFNAARQIAESEARRLHVRQACGADSSLQARVEQLLWVYEQEPDFLAAPAQGVYAEFAARMAKAPGCKSALTSWRQALTVTTTSARIPDLSLYFYSFFLLFFSRRSPRSHARSVNSTLPLVPLTTVQD